MPFPQTVMLLDTKASGTAGGTSTSGSWFVRDLNEINGDTTFITVPSGFELATNDNNGATPDATKQEFTLSAGTYTLAGSSVCYYNNNNRTRLYNVTDAAIEFVGHMAYSTNSVGVPVPLIGSFTITSTKTFRIEQRCQTTRASTGLGLNSSFGIDEVYSSYLITKIK